MRLIYSLGSSFAGDGLGLIAYHSLGEFHRHGALARVYAAHHRPTGMDPAVCDFLPGPAAWFEDRLTKGLYRFGLFKPAHLAHAWLYDRVVAHRLRSAKATVFFGWQGYALESIGVAKRRGCLSVLECCNSHIGHVQQVLSRERARLGLGPSELAAWVRRLEAEYAEADLLACPSSYVVRSFRERGFAPERLVQIPYGVDSRVFAPRGRQDAVFRVVFAGADMLRKGAHLLLEAWRQLGLEGAELVLCGTVYPQLRSRFEKLRTGSVVFRGHVREMVGEYERADLMVLPTFEDGFGLAILEAMACGLPVVATDHSAGRDVIEDGRNGFVVPVGDATAVADKVAWFYHHRERLEAMRVAARRTAEEFTWERRSRGLYEAIAARHGSGPPGPVR